MLIGASLSRSGPFQRQGEHAHDGLRLWVDCAETSETVPPPRLIVLDDRSRASPRSEHVRRLLVEERVDVLVGPYSSGLVLAVAPLAAAAGQALWNHGGTSDVIFQQGWPARRERGEPGQRLPAGPSRTGSGAALRGRAA